MDLPCQAAEPHQSEHGHWLEDGRLCCDVCPHLCKLTDGEQGRCHVRARLGQRLVSTTYGLASALCVAPIERAPLFHYLPGTPSLSLGTAGCNLFCSFCQVWESSQTRAAIDNAERVTPSDVAEIAAAHQCPTVTFTYNEPLVALEFARDTAHACRERGIDTVAVTAGHACLDASAELFAQLAAVCVDLKAFSDTFYRSECGGHLQPVLDVLAYLVRETKVWVEINTMLIPGLNDSEAELHEMASWVVSALGPGVPWHFSAFRPDHHLMHRPPTLGDTLQRARQIALGQGARHVYAGRGLERRSEDTNCHGCGSTLISRSDYHVCSYQLDREARCRSCGSLCPGVFGDAPGGWGPARVPVHPADHLKHED